MTEPTCTATLTTATVHDRCQWENVDGGCNHHNCHRFSGVWRYVELHTLTCSMPRAGHDGLHQTETFIRGAKWQDRTPGATPHVPPVEVSDAEVEAAWRVMLEIGWAFPGDNPATASIRAVLVAAYEAREVEA